MIVNGVSKVGLKREGGSVKSGNSPAFDFFER